MSNFEGGWEVKQNRDKVGQGGWVGKQNWDVLFFLNFRHFFYDFLNFSYKKEDKIQVVDDNFIKNVLL